jgi:hypothetical protein
MEEKTLSIDEHPDFQLLVKEDGISLYCISSGTLQYVMPVKSWNPLQYEYSRPVNYQFEGVIGLQNGIFLTLLKEYKCIYANARSCYGENWYKRYLDSINNGIHVNQSGNNFTFRYPDTDYNKKNEITDNIIQTLLDRENLERIITFNNHCYSFEEWLNCELFYNFSKAKYDVIARPRVDDISDIKKHADLRIKNFDNNKDLIIEVKIIHDSTLDKYIQAIESDRKALINFSNKGTIALQLIIIASSQTDIYQSDVWNNWLMRLSFWRDKQDFNYYKTGSMLNSVRVIGYFFEN